MWKEQQTRPAEQQTEPVRSRRKSRWKSRRKSDRVAEEADQVVEEMIAAEQRVNGNKARGQVIRAGEGAVEGGTESSSEDQKHEQRTGAGTRSKPRAAEGSRRSEWSRSEEQQMEQIAAEEME